ncbi:cysteine proteinase [Paxillus ammoniavirescens]|nr:cysteine proteinase [Paxillus ammoniavirescens]
MPFKRKRRVSPAPKGLAAGEQLKRAKLAGRESSAWGWVGTEVSDPSQITLVHRLMTCGLSGRNGNPFCGNKYVSKPDKHKPAPSTEEPEPAVAKGELENDIIVVSDDEPPPCNKKVCKNNPNCLNYLGQEKWEDEEVARGQFVQASDLGFNPILDARDPDLPVGLKNLGATCYANAFLQVWFRDLAFRHGVYQCQPSQDPESNFEDSPVFQLQVTFAALQESTQNVYNPAKFAESLKLSTSEQQDAQEFSKLFMSHLDNEFQKQVTPSLRTLISEQFQGQQVYGTLCHNCRNKSERTTDFLELEINIENNARLEDRIAALLQNEKLTGDNKYSCSNCASLQDATRYTELRSLPPVLHFSLLRFVYDFASMERKKSKHNLLFPTILDMSRFVSPEKSAGGAGQGESVGNTYELRGVLLHKGTSAYHGHYEAQVFDTASKAWFQFDDETVTKIDLLGEKRHSNSKELVDVLNGSGVPKKGTNQPRARPAKKRRIDDSDDEIVELPSPAMEARSSLLYKAPEGDIFSSKDSYMLIYARKEEPPILNHAPTPNLTQSTPDPKSSPVLINGASRPCVEPNNSDATGLIPPQRAREVVKALNAKHDEACEVYARKEKQVKERFAELREWMRSVYTHWQIDSIDEDAVIVSRRALEGWLSKPFEKPKENKSRSQSVTEDAEVVEVVPVSDILCDHGGLHPNKANNMKRISRKAYEKFAAREDCDIGLVRSPLDVCEICVREPFIERLYQIEHPRLVAQFDEVCDVEQGEPGHWLSKAWLKDWRLQKPRMHVPLHGDPAPDSAEFRGHVRCEHDQLSLVSTARRSISSQACEILKGIFPQWTPVSTNEELCAICEASINSSKEDKRELRKKAEDEKARLRHMHDNALIGNTLLLENILCAVLPADFVRTWRKWLSRPTEAPRPNKVDTSPLFCEHGNLVFDPNAQNDWDSSIALIQMSEWLILHELYTCGSVVAVEKRIVEDPMGVFDSKFVHETPVCHDCRLKRRLDYDLTDITVRFLSVKTGTGGDADVAAPQQRSGEDVKREPVHLGSRTTAGTRQSKRIRQGRERRDDTKLRVSKSMTIKDIKVQLHETLKIPTICQRLFYKDQELADNTVTVESLGILMNDTLDLREEAENEDNLTTSPDGRARKRRKEEKGFGGTLLSASGATLSADAGTSSEGEPHETTKPCPACTFRNLAEDLLCQMCGASMAGVGE